GRGLPALANHRSDDRDRHAAGTANHVTLALSACWTEVDPYRYRSVGDAALYASRRRDLGFEGWNARTAGRGEQGWLPQNQWPAGLDQGSFGCRAAGNSESSAADDLFEYSARGASCECD